MQSICKVKMLKNVISRIGIVNITLSDSVNSVVMLYENEQ